METVVIKTHTKADAKFLKALAKRIGAPTKVVDAEEMQDIYMASLIETGLKNRKRQPR